MIPLETLEYLDEHRALLTADESAVLCAILEREALEHARAIGGADALAYWMVTERSASFRVDALHRVMDEFLDGCIRDGVDAMICAPTAHGKTVWALGRVAMWIGEDPTLRVKVVSSDWENASARTAVIAANIDQSPRFNAMYPKARKGEPWGAKGYTLQRPGGISQVDPTLESFGVLSNATGPRADVLLFDDCTTQKNAILTPAEREKVFRAIVEGFTSRLCPRVKGTPRGMRLYLYNPWHQDDASARLDTDKGLGFRSLRLRMAEPATHIEVWIEGEHVKDVPLATGLGWDVEAIAHRRKTFGETGYNRLYRLQPVSDEDSKIPMGLLESRAYQWTGAMNWAEGDLFLGLDPAYSTKRASDEAVLCAVWRSRTEKTAAKKAVHYLLPAPFTVSGKWGSDLFRKAAQAWASMPQRPRRFAIEANGPQAMVPEQVKKAAQEIGAPIPESAVLRLNPSADKTADIAVTVGGALELGELRIPKDAQGEWMLPKMVLQLFELGVGSHDDQADALKMALQASADSKGGGMRFGSANAANF